MAVWSPNYDANSITEKFGTRRESWNRTSPTATVTLQVDYDKAGEILYDLIQYHRPWPYRPQVQGSFFLPPMRVQSVTIRYPRSFYSDPNEGTGDANQAMDYLYAELDVSYATEQGIVYNPDPTWLNSSQWCKDFLYAEEEWEPDITYLTTDYKKYVWEAVPGHFNGEKEPLKKAEEIGIPQRRGKIVRKVSGYRDLIYIREIDPVGQQALQIFEWEGKTHSKDYTSNIDGWTYAANSLLLTGLKIRKTYFNYQPLLYTYTLEAELTYREVGWNEFYRNVSNDTTDLSDYYKIYYKDTPSVQFTPIGSADMTMFIFSEGDRNWCQTEPTP